MVDEQSVQAPPERATLRAVKLIAPLRQGSCDNLCGLYAVVNALRLTLSAQRMLTATEVQALFDAGLEHIDERRALAASLRDGIAGKLWRSVGDALCVAAAERTGIPLAIARPFARKQPPRGEAFAQIELFVRRQQTVLIPLEGAYSHYTVIYGYSATSFRLFDSNGHQRIRRAACGIGADGHESRHWLDLRALTVIAASLPTPDTRRSPAHPDDGARRR